MIDRVVGGSRYLALLAVIGSFLASATVQVYGLVRVVVNAYNAYIGRDYSDQAAKEVLVDAVSTIDLFLVGTILFVLDRELRRAPAGAVTALGFGPGLTMEGAVLSRP